MLVGIFAFEAAFATAVSAAPSAASGPGTTGIDLTSALWAAVHLPAQISSVQHTLVWCTLVLGVVGLANAALLAALLVARTERVRPPATATAPAVSAPEISGAQPLSSAPPPLSIEPPRLPVTYVSSAGFAPAPPAAPAKLQRVCLGCGGPVSAGSKSGRCRRCVQFRSKAGTTPEFA
jgi:hypothetical protein